MFYRRPIGSLLLALKQPRLREFRRVIEGFSEVQKQTLGQILGMTSGSAFALAHGLQAGSHHFNDGPAGTLRKAFPVCDYEYLRPWIERFRTGDARALFGSDSGVTPDLCRFVTTSGTTGLPKLIPVTPQSFAAEANGWQSWGLQLFADHRDAAFLDVLPVSSATKQSMSGLATWDMQPRSFKTLYAAPSEAQGIEPFTLKLKALLRLTVANRHIGMLMAANPSTLLMMMQLLEAHSFDLVRDLFNGSFFAGTASTPPGLQGRLTRRERSSARRLDAILAKDGKLSAAAIWPDLKVVATWMGGTLAQYGQALRPALGHVPWRDYGLVASEGRFTIPFHDNTPDGVLDPRVAWYEFTPPDGGEVIDSRDLIPGESYRLVVTTMGGLIRYDMHDIVECRGYAGTAPVIRFVRKSSHFSNITGEKLCAAQVSQALSRLAGTFPDLAGTTRFMTLVAMRDQPLPSYRLYSENPREQDWQGFVQALDSELAQLNCEYDAKRRSGRLGPPEFACLPPGTLDRMRALHLQRSPGASPEQYKPPVLLDDLISPLRDMALQV
ncbi:MAG: hypothetical protein RIQ81_1896 [Pseudomonadota bacterium]